MGIPVLTHWGRVTHICVSNLTIIGSDNGLSPGRRQAIIWPNAGILLIVTWGTNLQWNFNRNINIYIQEKAFKTSSAKWRLFSIGLNELKIGWSVRPSYLKHGNPFTGKTASLYWDAPVLVRDWDIPKDNSLLDKTSRYTLVTLV